MERLNCLMLSTLMSEKNPHQLKDPFLLHWIIINNSIKVKPDFTSSSFSLTHSYNDNVIIYGVNYLRQRKLKNMNEKLEK